MSWVNKATALNWNCYASSGATIFAEFMVNTYNSVLFTNNRIPFYDSELGEKIWRNSISEFENNIDLLSAKNIPELLKLILSYTNVNNREIYHTPSNFRIFSISQIIKNLNNNQKCIDFGYFSMGMGHAVTISWIIDTGKCFLRPDGGSNGYDAYYTQKVGNTIDPSTGSFISIDFNSNENTGISKQTNMIIFDIKDFLQYLINREYTRNRFGVITFPDNFKPINIY